MTQRGKLQLNFGAICLKILDIYKNRSTDKAPEYSKCIGSVKHHKSQVEVVELLLKTPYEEERPADIDFEFDLSARLAFNLVHNQSRIPEEIRKMARDCSVSRIEKNLTAWLLDDLSEQEKDGLLRTLDDLVHSMGTCDYMNLSSYRGLKAARPLANRYIAKCVHFSLQMPNTNGQRIDIGALNILPAFTGHEDPYRLVSGDLGSAAVEIVLARGEKSRQKPKKLYDFFDLTNKIQRKALLIRDVSYDDKGRILVTYDPFPYLGIQLRKLKARDIQQAYEFVRRHEAEFRVKRSWAGRRLSDMVKNGLKIGKWRAYGYFDAGQLVGYLDMKIRGDNSIELGVMLVNPKYRELHIASSLAYLARLLFPFCRIFGGTYEENGKMRNTFRATGFSNIHYYDPRTNQELKMVKERINPACPEDLSEDTNSVYYFAESIIVEAYRKRVSEAKQMRNGG